MQANEAEAEAGGDEEKEEAGETGEAQEIQDDGSPQKKK